MLILLPPSDIRDQRVVVDVPVCVDLHVLDLVSIPGVGRYPAVTFTLGNGGIRRTRSHHCQSRTWRPSVVGGDQQAPGLEIGAIENHHLRGHRRWWWGGTSMRQHQAVSRRKVRALEASSPGLSKSSSHDRNARSSALPVMSERA